MDPIGELEQLFGSRGGQDYLGEAVSVATHMLQAGALAEAERAGAQDRSFPGTPRRWPDAPAPDALIAAALLHDVGHILDGGDVRHEATGAEWLAQWFPDAVCAPVRLHVAAKRYLCFLEPEYFAQLSAASRASLELQGGVMTAAEAGAFEQLPWAREAVAVRRWDDAAKDPSVAPPPFCHFRLVLERVLQR